MPSPWIFGIWSLYIYYTQSFYFRYIDILIIYSRDNDFIKIEPTFDFTDEQENNTLNFLNISLINDN